MNADKTKKRQGFAYVLSAFIGGQFSLPSRQRRHGDDKPAIPPAGQRHDSSEEVIVNTGLRFRGTDYFGARYFWGAQGRFTSPDERWPGLWCRDLRQPATSSGIARRCHHVWRRKGPGPACRPRSPYGGAPSRRSRCSIGSSPIHSSANTAMHWAPNLTSTLFFMEMTRQCLRSSRVRTPGTPPGGAVDSPFGRMLI
jgi:hypothetical protein